MNVFTPFEKLCYQLATATTEEQNAFFKSIDGKIEEEEKESIMVGVSYFSMELNPKKKKAFMEATAKTLYKQFNE